MVAEPGELADKFVQSVKFSLLSIMRGRHRKYTSAITNIATLAELVAYRPYFQIGCIIHRYIGRQTQVCFFGSCLSHFKFVGLLLATKKYKMPVFLFSLKVMEDDQEIGAYMFRRTVPSMHLTPDNVRRMVGLLVLLLSVPPSLSLIIIHFVAMLVAKYPQLFN